MSKRKLVITITGEFFPETFPAFRSPRWSRGEEDPLATEMRLFCACERWAYQRLAEGMGRDDIKKAGQVLFGLNSRYADDACLRAQTLRESQRERLNQDIQETTKKLHRARRRLGWSMRKLVAAQARGAVRAVLAEMELAVKGRQARVAAIERELQVLQEHRRQKTLPKVVFGGRWLWRRVCKGRASREEWHAARKGHLYARGDESKGGNPNMKLWWDGEGFRLAVTLSHLSVQKGVDRLGRPVMSQAPRAEGRVWLPEKHREEVRVWLSLGLPYSVLLKRDVGGRYRVHVTLDYGVVPEARWRSGYLAVDTNPDGVALCHVGPGGQPERWPEGFEIPVPAGLDKYEGEFQVRVDPAGFAYIHLPDLADASGDRRTYLLGVLAKAVVAAARAVGKPLALEDLDFGKDRLGTNRRFNRMASNFPYGKMGQALWRRAAKERVPCRLVPPAHTSTIGHWKYQRQYGVTVHEAAALVIGRRAMGLREQIPRALQRRLAELRRQLAQTGHPHVPKEGNGMTRRARAILRRLGKRRIRLYNGLSRKQQEDRRSLWRDFKGLALALRRPRLAGSGKNR